MADIEVTVEELVAFIANSKPTAEDDAARLEYARAEIRASLEVLNRLPAYYRTIPQEGQLDLPEHLHGDHFRLAVHISGASLFAQCTAYGLSCDDCHGLTVMTGTQEVVFTGRGEQSHNYASAFISAWDGNCGPLTFELRDID